MPELRDLTCSIKYGKYKSPLKEYGPTYVDGYVQTFVAVPQREENFEIHLTSEVHVPTRLAVFVYVDGVLQCRRNDLGYSFGPPGHPNLVDFRLRHKEDNISGERYLARKWRFEKLLTISSDESVSKDQEKLEAIGSIEVVVLRIENRNPHNTTAQPVQAKETKPISSNQTFQVRLPNFGLDGADERHLDEGLTPNTFDLVSDQYDGPSDRPHRRSPLPAWPGLGPSPGHLRHSSIENARHPSSRVWPGYHPPLGRPSVPIYDPHAIYGPSPPPSAAGVAEDAALYERPPRLRVAEYRDISDSANRAHPPPPPWHYAYHDSPYHSPEYRYEYPTYWPHAHPHIPPNTEAGILGGRRGTYSPTRGVRYHDTGDKDKSSTSSKHSKKSSKSKNKAKNEASDPWQVKEPENSGDWGNTNNWNVENEKKDKVEDSGGWGANEGWQNDNAGWGANEGWQNDNAGWGAADDNDNKPSTDWNAGNVADAPANDNSGLNDAWGGNEQNKPADDQGWGNTAQTANAGDGAYAHPQSQTLDHANFSRIVGWLQSTEPANNGGNADGWGVENKKVETAANESSKSRKEKKHKHSDDPKPPEGITPNVAAAADKAGSHLKTYFSVDPVGKDADQKTASASGDIAPAAQPTAVPRHIVEKTGATHQVCAGPGFIYSFYFGRPRYIDSMSKPYAVFCFKYRSYEKLGELFPTLKKEGKIKKERGDYKQRMMDMEKEELFEELRIAKAHAGYNTDSTLDSSSDEDAKKPGENSKKAGASSNKAVEHTQDQKDGKTEKSGW